jgi:hypothetical protein
MANKTNPLEGKRTILAGILAAAAGAAQVLYGVQIDAALQERLVVAVLGLAAIFGGGGSVVFRVMANLGTLKAAAEVIRDLRNELEKAKNPAQRNGTNAQTARTYGTYTDTSNYRRIAIAMTTAGVASIAPEGAGTGASGNVLHISGLPTSNPGAGILWNDSGTVKVGT